VGVKWASLIVFTITNVNKLKYLLLYKFTYDYSVSGQFLVKKYQK